jgi:hypothetical protein
MTFKETNTSKFSLDWIEKNRNVALRAWYYNAAFSIDKKICNAVFLNKKCITRQKLELYSDQGRGGKKNLYTQITFTKIIVRIAILNGLQVICLIFSPSVVLIRFSFLLRLGSFIYNSYQLRSEPRKLMAYFTIEVFSFAFSHWLVIFIKNLLQNSSFDKNARKLICATLEHPTLSPRKKALIVGGVITTLGIISYISSKSNIQLQAEKKAKTVDDIHAELEAAANRWDVLKKPANTAGVCGIYDPTLKKLRPNRILTIQQSQKGFLARQEELKRRLGFRNSDPAFAQWKYGLQHLVHRQDSGPFTRLITSEELDEVMNEDYNFIINSVQVIVGIAVFVGIFFNLNLSSSANPPLPVWPEYEVIRTGSHSIIIRTS